MDGQVRFRDDDNATYSVGVEEVENTLYYGCSTGDRRILHDFLDSITIIEDFAITPMKFR
jgi:hypothetical protein